MIARLSPKAKTASLASALALAMVGIAIWFAVSAGS